MRHYVQADCYEKTKRELDQYGMGDSLCPVDIYGAYVSMDVTKTSKESEAELQEAADVSRIRFGLNKY